MLRAGNTLMQAIEAISQMTLKVRFKNALIRMLVSIQGGSSFAQAIEKESTMFPPIVSRLIASGEASGELEAMLARSASNQERELEMTLGNLMAIFEPLMIVIMAAVVCTIVFAILLPIIEMNNLVS